MPRMKLFNGFGVIDIKIHEYEKGLVWDEHDKFINQSWSELKEKIKNTHGGIGIIAADFDELLRYGQNALISPPERRRNHFARLVANASLDEDIELLSDILAYMLIKPWETNLHAGWFITYLRKGENLEDFDVDRANKVLNGLFNVNKYAAEILMYTLNDFNVYNLLENGNLLRRELRQFMIPAVVFLSYSRGDKLVVDKLYPRLLDHGLNVWIDEHELLPDENWGIKIRQTIRSCEFAIVCFSEQSIKKPGFFQEEIKIIQELNSGLEHSIYCIPLTLHQFDRSLIPEGFRDKHIIDLAENNDNDFEKCAERIKKAIHNYRSERLV
jgi:hypothetical protein